MTARTRAETGLFHRGRGSVSRDPCLVYPEDLPVHNAVTEWIQVRVLGGISVN